MKETPIARIYPKDVDSMQYLELTYGEEYALDYLEAVIYGNLGKPHRFRFPESQEAYEEVQERVYSDYLATRIVNQIEEQKK